MDNLIIDLFNKKIITIDNNTINCKFNNLISYPYLINTIVKFIYDKIKYIESTNLIGIGNCMQHISSIISYNYNIPLLMLNKNRIVDGIYEDNICVVLFNDILDNPSKLLKYISISFNLKPSDSCLGQNWRFHAASA